MELLLRTRTRYGHQVNEKSFLRYFYDKAVIIYVLYIVALIQLRFSEYCLTSF